MKEMVGGCCVCSDERGWAENPLVYCDGSGCNVAVHQACYGIVHVPTGPWYCRKCESQERTTRVKCELCPLKDGALKRTDTGVSWCHVVCALFIPEAWFANVQTMEPIVLKNLPPERFSKTCYICEEQDQPLKSTQGACMQCNKNGCKQSFHVTCAQGQGLLCEEAGNYGDNVKYCGYCDYHYKKLKKDAHIKIIPAFKPIPADNATPDHSPEKSLDRIIKRGNKAEAKCNSEVYNSTRSSVTNFPVLSQSNLPKERGGTATPPSTHQNSPPPPSHASSGIGMSDSSVVSSTESPSQEEIEVQATVVNISSEKLPQDPIANGVDQKFLVAEPKFTVPNSNEGSSSAVSASSASMQTTTFSGVLENFVTGNAVVTQLGRRMSVEDSGNEEELDVGAAKRPRSRSQEKADKKVKRVKKNGVPTVTTKKCSKAAVPSNKETTPPVTKKVKTKIESSGNPSSLTGMNNYTVFGGSPYFQSLSAPGPLSLFGQSGSPAVSTDNGLTGPPKVFPSVSNASQSPADNSEFPSNLEQLLERQWEQGSQFLMQQGQHFDIASLLNCLHQLKSENQRLEESIQSLSSRRDHLLAVNARLSLPYTPTNNQSTSPEGSSSRQSPKTSQLSDRLSMQDLNMLQSSGRSSSNQSPITPPSGLINPASICTTALTVPSSIINPSTTLVSNINLTPSSQHAYILTPGPMASVVMPSSIVTDSQSQIILQKTQNIHSTGKDNT